MKVAYQDSLQYRLWQRIQELPYGVILRADVADLAKPRQITYALNALIKAKKIARIGYGVYAKLRWSNMLKEAYLEQGFANATREALDRLKVKWQPGRAEQEYNAGATTQIPTNAKIQLKSRFHRKLSYQNMTLEYEPSRYVR